MGSEPTRRRCHGDGYPTCQCEPECDGCARVICVCPPPDEQRAGGVTKADLADAECYCDVCGSDDALGVRPICMVCYTAPTDIAERLAAAERGRDEAREAYDQILTSWAELRVLRDAATARAEKYKQLYERSQGELGKAHGENDRLREAARQREETLARERARAETAEGLLRGLVEHLDIGDWSSPEWRQRVRDAHAHIESLKGGSDAEG